MSDNTSMVLCFGTVASVFLAFAGCTINTNNKIAESVKNGADPMRMSCALSVDVPRYCDKMADE